MRPIRRRPGYSARVRSSEITPQNVYQARRALLKSALAAGVVSTIGLPRESAARGAPLEYRPSERYSTDEAPNSYEDITTYNNFYEFGTDKADPARLSDQFEPRPWSVTISGESEKQGTVDLEDLLRSITLEERIYRLRCVEAWSMVIPWVGFPLADLLKRFQPTSRAKYVAFKTVYRPKQMPGQRYPTLDWPYVEGLRIDEAMHPLTIVGVGLYGETLPNQNGAPLRVIVPWKYGFKSIKSIVEIRFTEHEPPTSWHRAAPHEYGFYANVNPDVDHPRWSQARERRIGAGIFAARQPTRLFNGYGEEVADLYRGLDLRKYY